METIDEISKYIRKDCELAGLEATPYIACVVYNKRAGTKIIGVNYGDKEISLDLLAGFLSAIGVIAENKLIGVTYKDSIAIWMVKGKKFDVTMITEAKHIIEDVVRNKILGLIENLESNILITKATDSGSGDTRPYISHTYEIIKRFPFFKICDDYWDLYHPFSRHTIEEIKKRCDWCKEETNVIFEHVLSFLNGKRNVTDIINSAQTDKITETDILTVITTLYKYRLLEFIPIYTPDRMFLKRVPTASTQKMASIYGKQLQRILDECDGKKNILEISTDLNIPYDSLNYVVKQMIVNGLVEIQLMRG